MARLNRLEIIGHLGGDPELKYTPNGVSVCELSIAVNVSAPQGNPAPAAGHGNHASG